MLRQFSALLLLRKSALVCLTQNTNSVPSTNAPRHAVIPSHTSSWSLWGYLEIKGKDQKMTKQTDASPLFIALGIRVCWTLVTPSTESKQKEKGSVCKRGTFDSWYCTELHRWLYKGVAFGKKSQHPWTLEIWNPWAQKLKRWSDLFNQSSRMQY